MRKILITIFITLFAFPVMAQSISGNYRYASFSPGNKKIVLNYCDEENCHVVVLNLKTRKLKVIQKAKDESWRWPRYVKNHPDRIVLTIRDMAENVSQIALYTFGTPDPIILTKSHNFKFYPDITKDGSRIIYLKREAPRYFESFSEVFVKYKEEQFLTYGRNLGLSPPYYLADDLHYIFSAERLALYPKVLKSLRKKYKGNIIYSGGDRDGEFFWPKRLGIPTPIFKFKTNSSHPSISKDGNKILFISRINEFDGLEGNYRHDLFIRESGNIKRVTKLQQYMRGDASISQDGLKAVFFTGKAKARWKPADQPPTPQYMWMINTDGSGLAQFHLPPDLKSIRSGKGQFFIEYKD